MDTSTFMSPTRKRFTKIISLWTSSVALSEAFASLMVLSLSIVEDEVKLRTDDPFVCWPSRIFRLSDASVEMES